MMSEGMDKVMLEAQRGLERLDALKVRLAEAGFVDRAHLLAAHSMVLGYLAGSIDDDDWEDAVSAALRYVAAGILRDGAS